jgi:general secretion pathway protein G
MIELLMVMIIIGILTSLVTTGAFRAIRSAKEDRARSAIAALEAALERYRLDTGVYPNNTSGTNSFVLWLETGDGSTGWDGPYMRFDSGETSSNAFLDPWGNAYIYYHNQSTSKGYNHNYGGYNTQNAFDIWSYGPDGANDVNASYINTDDDITNWD